jgi:hypothetical protein
MSLHANQLIDARDAAGQWYYARVTRLFHTPDKVLEKVAVHFEGFSSSWDEQIDVHSDRLAPHQRRALGGRETARVAPDVKVDDLLDPRDAFAVFRVRHFSSFFLSLCFALQIVHCFPLPAPCDVGHMCGLLHAGSNAEDALRVDTLRRSHQSLWAQQRLRRASVSVRLARG